jgi:glyoxylase-like metal-dependent hydrolase (beta-lactamase superfamily II)
MLHSLTVGPLGERCYLLEFGPPGEAIIVDPGDEADRILALLDSVGLKPACILATHGHLDHTAAIPDLMAAFAARGLTPPIAIHREDAAYFGASSEATNRATFTSIGATGFFKHYFRPLPEASIILEDGDALLGSAWKVIHTPGHTRGSICLYNAAESCLVSGDTLFAGGVGRTDGPDSDPEALATSITTRLLVLPDDTQVHPGHGGPTTIGNEREGLLY